MLVESPRQGAGDRARSTAMSATATVTRSLVTPSTYELVAVDAYRDIHKGIRADLFDLTGAAGRIDPSCPGDVADLARHVDQTADFLVVHAGHEDTHLGPVMSELLPELNATIERDHAVLEGRLDDLRGWARNAVAAPEDETRGQVQTLYIELASFTSAYLAHQDLEERVVAPELHRVIGAAGVLAIDQAIVASIPPDQMAAALAI